MIENTITRAVQAAISTANFASTTAKRARRRVRRAMQGNPRSYAPNARSLTITRTGGLNTITLVAGTASGHIDYSLNAVQVSDLLDAFDAFRINWVEFVLYPQVDPGQSGVVNNTQATVYLANEPSGQLTTPTTLQVGSFSNAKVQSLTATTPVIRYRFKPVATNTLAGGSIGLSGSDWIVTNATGAAVAHKRLLYNIDTNNATSTQKYTYYPVINFTVRGLY